MWYRVPYKLISFCFSQIRFLHTLVPQLFQVKALKNLVLTVQITDCVGPTSRTVWGQYVVDPFMEP